jgi:hypothetical protein
VPRLQEASDLPKQICCLSHNTPHIRANLLQEQHSDMNRSMPKKQLSPQPIRRYLSPFSKHIRRYTARVERFSAKFSTALQACKSVPLNVKNHPYILFRQYIQLTEL